jgi:hypothetical protein
MAKSSVTLEVDLTTAISVVETTGDRLLIVIGGPDDPQKLALIMPSLSAMLLAARISTCRLGQLREEFEGFVTARQAVSKAMESLETVRAERAAERVAATAAGVEDANVVDLSSRRQP